MRYTRNTIRYISTEGGRAGILFTCLKTPPFLNRQTRFRRLASLPYCYSGKFGTEGTPLVYKTRMVPQRDYYCKRAILFLSSSKILTPHPPRKPASVSSPPLFRGEDTLAGRRGGWGGGQYFGRREIQDCPLTVIISLGFKSSGGPSANSIWLSSLIKLNQHFWRHVLAAEAWAKYL